MARTKQSAKHNPAALKSPLARKQQLIQSGKYTHPLKSKKRRSKPGVKALREIKLYQKTTDNLIPKLPFQRCVREVVSNLGNPSNFGIATSSANTDTLRMTPAALFALQEAAEQYLIDYIADSYLLTIHAKRQTIMPTDMRVVKRLRYPNI